MKKLFFLFVLVCCFIFLISEPVESSSRSDTDDGHEIVLYWGQNTARRNEKPLEHFCTTGHYDVIVLNKVTQFFAAKTRYPSLNLAHHCGPKIRPQEGYPGIYNCDPVANAIKLCQSRGIRVVLGLSSETGSKWLTKKGDGIEFANKIWNLFLGGKEKKSVRPFGDAVLNGINIGIRTGKGLFLDEAFAEFSRLYGTSNDVFTSTLTVSCATPTMNLIEISAPIIDSVYIKHDFGSRCHPTGDGFETNLNQWVAVISRINLNLNKELKFSLVLIQSKDTEAYVTTYQDFYDIYQTKLKNQPLFKGVVLDDAGWDDGQLVLPQNKRYSTILWALFGRSELKPTGTGLKRTEAKPTEETVQKKKEIPEGPLVGAFWGFNLAEGTTGNSERSLRELCDETSYKIIVLNTLADDEDDQNKDNLPSLSFSRHCHQPYGPAYKSYLKCPQMEQDIKYCQSKGVKIVLSIGGSTRFIGFGDAKKAKHFADMLWKLFLGGTKEAENELLPRTFGSAVLDGINIEVLFGDPLYFVDFVRELRRVMDSSVNSQEFLITANPSCIHPSYILKDAFKEAIGAFDHLFVNFDDQNCDINKPEKFEPAFQVWYDYAIKENGPNVWVGLASDPRRTANDFLKREDAKKKLQLMRLLYNKFGGVIFNDASWDYENKKDGVMYSKFISQVLDGGPDDQDDEEEKKQEDEPVVTKRKETNSGPRLINGRPVVNTRGTGRQLTANYLVVLSLILFLFKIIL